MGKLIDRDVLVAHLERMMAARQIDRLPKSGYAKAIEDVAGCPTVDAVPVVRCKNCKHRPIDHREEYREMTGFGLEFPDDHCPCQCEDDWYSWYPPDDWFCADGKRRDEDDSES